MSSTDGSGATFGANLRAAREALGESRGRKVTQLEIANAVGAREGDVRRWETGKNLPQASIIPALAAALETHPNYLFGIDDDMRLPRRKRRRGNGGAGRTSRSERRADRAIGDLLRGPGNPDLDSPSISVVAGPILTAMPALAGAVLAWFHGIGFG